MMYRIGEFSVLSKTAIKTLRYYEKEGLLIPSYVDQETGYRFYETLQLPQLAKIISLRQIGLSIHDIKDVLNGANISEILFSKKQELEIQIVLSNHQLLQINYLLEGKNMDYQVVIKELPACIVYFKEGIINGFNELSEFILSSATECRKTNPTLKCVEPDYCFVNYLDGEYREENMKVKYAQAVTEMGVSNETIQFEKLQPVQAACIYHKGSYDHLREAYSFIVKWIEENGYQIAQPIRERYIDGIWNKENADEWLTEIQVPITEK